MTGISHISTGNDHEQIRLAKRYLRFSFIMLPDQSGKLQQMLSAFPDLCISKLEFDQRIASVIQMKHSISLKIITIVIV